MRPRAVAVAVMTVMLTTTELVRAAPLDAQPPSLTARQVLGPLESAHDSVTALKRAFIREHRIVVLRMHDHWHRRQPDAIQAGMTRAAREGDDRSFRSGR